jgi:Acyltransferase
MSQLGLDYPTQWGRGYAARIFREIFHSYVLSPVIRYLSTLTVIGDENIKGPGPFIFVANHASHLDTALLLTAMPDPQRRRTVVAAAMDNFFMDSGRAFRTVLFFNAVPVDRQKVSRRSAQLLQDLVEDGWNLVIFPEGGRTPDGDLQEFLLTFMRRESFKGPDSQKPPPSRSSTNGDTPLSFRLAKAFAQRLMKMFDPMQRASKRRSSLLPEMCHKTQPWRSPARTTLKVASPTRGRGR